MPHRRGSFHEDWNDLLTRFAHRRKHDEPRAMLLDKAQKEARQTGRDFDPHHALFERAHSD